MFTSIFTNIDENTVFYKRTWYCLEFYHQVLNIYILQFTSACGALYFVVLISKYNIFVPLY